MSTDLTPNGLPFPLGDDPVTLGDDRIRELAQELDQRVVTTASTNADTDPASAFPMGLSLLSITAANAAQWPLGHNGLVLTTRAPGRASQLVFSSSGASPLMYYRNGGDTSWSPWTLAGGEPAGAASVVTNASGVGLTTVTLPSGRTSPPVAVVATINSSAGATQYLQVRTTAITTSSFQILISPVGGTPSALTVAVLWMAR